MPEAGPSVTNEEPRVSHWQTRRGQGWDVPYGFTVEVAPDPGIRGASRWG